MQKFYKINGAVVKKLLLLIPLIYFAGCAPALKVYYDSPFEFDDKSALETYIDGCIPPLTGVKVFLDPGHGGDDRKNKGPQGIAIEADVNLRVSLHLREFLQKAGATVFMSREKDETVGLKERSTMANESGADIFISVHHNAPGKAGDNRTNYTSTYYHAKETDFEYEPMERDLAKFIQRDLAYVMRNSGGLGSFDGTYSDYWIYPGSGFSVLRLTKIPAVLLECGFHTHRWEEERLAIEEFNRIQAWGIFKGLCRYYKAGVPKISYVKSIEKGNDTKIFSFIIEDKNGINEKSVRVYVDSSETNNFRFDKQKSTVNVEIKNSGNDSPIIRIIAANVNGNHAYPFHFEARLNEQ